MIDLQAGTGLIRTEDHRYFWNKEGPFPGITTVQGVLDKSAPLMLWAAKQVAIAAVRDAYKTAWAKQSGTADDDLVKALARLPEKQRDAAADLGSAVHWYAEQMGLGKAPAMDAAVWPFIRQYQDWRDQWGPEIVHVEYQGVNLTHRYGGTGDLIVRKAGETWLIDIKSGRYYPETALQLVACARLDFIGRPNEQDQTPVPAIDRYGVLDLKPDGWKVVEYRFDVEATFAAFASLCSVYHWKQGHKRVMQPAIEGRAPEGESHDDAA